MTHRAKSRDFIPVKLKVDFSESPFPKPQMTEVDMGAPPVWVVILGGIAVAVILACIFLWSAGL